MKEFKGISRVWTRFLLEKVVTQKPSEVRMGKGKGKFFSWVAPVKAGMMLFEFSRCLITKILQQKINVVMGKLSVKTKLVFLDR
jgi:large subunit ribosomal protein L16